MLASRRTSVHPAGGVIAGAPRTLTTASNASPEATPAGAGMTRVVAVTLLAELALRKAIPLGGAAAVVNDQVTGAPESALLEVSVMPAVSVAV